MKEWGALANEEAFLETEGSVEWQEYPKNCYLGGFLEFAPCECLINSFESFYIPFILNIVVLLGS